MRYTEARLARITSLLLDEIDEGTVDFVPNYDGSTQEPAVLPARLPVLLLNGASGIAVGMATEIPSHNLVEVSRAAIALIRDPGLGVAGLMEHIQGPDFPGGAQIITPREEMIAAYESGRGSIRTRARWSIERLARGQWQLVVTELPPGTSSRKVLEEIDALTNPQNKPGKKSLTPEQQREKQLMLSMLDKARDESDRTHPVRLVFEPKTSRIDETEFVNLLLAKTSLEGNVSINMVMVGLDGRPTGKSLLTFMREWVEFRLDAPRLYGNAYDAAQSYSKGAQVYYDEGSSSGSLVPVAGYAVQGDFYEWTSQNPSGVGTIPPLTWNRIRIPKLFANPIIHGVHADYRRSTGEIEPMQAAEADFAKAVDAALDQTLRQQGSTRKINFRTY